MGESAVGAAAKKLHKFVGDHYGGSKSKNGKKNKPASKSDKDTSDTLDEVSMDDLTDLNDPDRDSKLSGEKLTQEKLKNLFKAIQNLDSRISKLEPPLCQLPPSSHKPMVLRLYNQLA